MRPHKLTLEGFTSFREKLELDFTGLDLFAITGPTGAGKSSLIDAICFALYGQVPRVGDDYKQLISHGAERLSVMLEFGVGKERYRIARTARPDKPSQQRKFAQKYGLGFQLLSDPDHATAEAVDVWKEKSMYGRTYMGIVRSAFLIDDSGTISEAWYKISPADTPKKLLAALS